MEHQSRASAPQQKLVQARYVHFNSKEQLIAGICKRDRRQFADSFQYLANAEDTITALGQLAENYLVDDAPHKRQHLVEIGAQATRNHQVQKLFQAIDGFVEDSFTAFIEKLVQTRRASLAIDPCTAAKLILIIGDGLFWRTAVLADPRIEEKLPAVMATIGRILGTVATNPSKTNTVNKISHEQITWKMDCPSGRDSCRRCSGFRSSA